MREGNGRQGSDSSPLLVKLLTDSGGVSHVVDVRSSKPGDSAITLVLIFSIFIALCGSFVVGCAVGYTSPVESAIMEDLGLSTADFSLFGSMLTIGGLMGSLVNGKLTDYLGRRFTMGLSDIFFVIGWLLISFSQGVWTLDLGRFLLGFGAGLMTFVAPVYLAEITPKNLRGGTVLLCQLMMCCGISLMFFVGLVISWRFLALIGVIPSAMQLVGIFFIPESPRWLVSVGQDKQYEESLCQLRGSDVDISLEAADIKEYTVAIETVSEDAFFSMFQKKYAYALTVGLGLMALQQFGGTNGVIYYASNVFSSAGFSSTIGTVSMAIIQLPTTAVGVYLMDKAGRRPLLLFSVAGMFLACLLSGLSFLLKEHGWMTGVSPYLVYVGYLVFSSAYPLGMGGIPYILMSEIFPMNIKGPAGSLATIVNWSTSWIVAYAFSFMFDWSSWGTFFVFAGVNVFSLIFIAKLVPETKGRTLEEIQASITGIQTSG